MAKKYTHTYCILGVTLILSVLLSPTYAQSSPQQKADTLKYPLTETRGDSYSSRNRNTFDFSDTAFIKRNIEYDPKTKLYYVTEKIGNHYYRTPTSFTRDEFLRLQGQRDEEDYFHERANLLSELNRRSFKPKFKFSNEWVNRITGNLGNVGNTINNVSSTVKNVSNTVKNLPSQKIEIKPTGFVDISAGYQGQNVDNPTLPERARKTGGLDFNEDAQVQVDANIGDKIKLPINYNTLANFNFQNQLKLDYHGKPDEILKSFEAGNINFVSKGTLIPGIQSLFGIKSQLQFGKLFATAVLANQSSQRQTLGLQGGAATQQFVIRADEYEENRHFLLAQYFRTHYNQAMSTLPVVRSNFQIKRIEVWITNRTGATTDTRDVVAFADLGEHQPYNTSVIFPGPDTLPSNNANTLLQQITNNPATRNSTQVQSVLTAMGLQPVQDFEKTFARKLQPTDYYFNPQIGFLSLNQQLQPDEVLGVAYEYTYNGRIYQVGEFSQDIPPDSTGNTTKVLFLKLLKATSQRTNLPIWRLMMKNVYSVGFGQLQRDGFDFNVVYDEPSLGQKRYLPVSVTAPQIVKGTPILTLVNLDRLNSNNDPQPDGVFDYVEGYTVISPQSRVIFPVLEPFGHDLDYAVNPADRANVLFYPLYDTIKAIAANYANLDRFKMVGKSKSANNTDYQLGFNIPRGSVVVTAGGRTLQENVDYEINYDLGTLKVINPAIVNAGLPVQVQYENNATYGLQQKNFMGLQLDYLVNRHLTLGGTFVRLGERPFFTKQSYGEDPIRNSMYGVNFDYRNDFPQMTKWLNKLPFYSSKTMSTISAYGESAVLVPGHAPEIGQGGQGVIYLDDFEGTQSNIDLRFPLISWTLASTPQNSPDQFGNPLFPEATLSNDLRYGYNRAKLAWYNIEPVLQERTNSDNPLRNNLAELSKPETRQVLQSEIFPQRTTDLGQDLLQTFDLAYYPKEKGPYNFNTTVDPATGNLINPTRNWGGIMRNIDQTDFETSNVEYIDFWLQDPFINRKNGGQLYFNLGDISEDVLKDGKRQYENGLPAPSQPNIPVDASVWGVVPRNPIQVTNAFTNDPNDRPFQDAGFDGLTDTAEQRFYQPYLTQLAGVVGPGSAAFQKASADPSNDDFKGYRDYPDNTGILDRYKNINNPQGNSPVAGANDQFTNAFTLYPDQEELNRDNTMNETEQYFQYRVDLQPGMDQNTNKYITDVRSVPVHLANGQIRTEKWYHFRVPISDYQAKVGNIPDFKSIRFIRMFVTDFADTTILRFGQLQLVRNQWRKFNYEIDTSGNYTPLPANDPTLTNILAVNVEENDSRDPIPYRIPTGIERQQQLSNNNVELLLNEQSLSLKLCNLQQNEARGVFKSFLYDLRSYGRLSMFIHLESSRLPNGSDLAKGDETAVIRIGNDYVSNYYEIKIPLESSPWHTTDTAKIWPSGNYLDFDLSVLTDLKIRRNSTAGASPAKYYSETIGGKKFGIMGNPNLGEVQGIFMGVQNNKLENVCLETWFDELRLSKLDEKGGWAATGRVDIHLADLGTIDFNGSYKSVGWGTLEQGVNERSKEDLRNIDINANLDLGKLLPKSAAIQIPVYAGITRSESRPQYDPYDLDVLLRDKINGASSKSIADSIRNDAIDQTTIKTLNFTSVKRTKPFGKKPQLWDLSNIDINYSYVHQQTSNPIIQLQDIKRTRAAVAYNYAPQPAFVEPFKKLIKSKSPWLALVRDFNFNYKPSLLSVRADVFRQFGETKNRNVGTPFELPSTFDKRFTFDRYYSLRWDFTRSLTLDFNAVDNAIVDEPYGSLDTKEKKDSVRNNFFKGGRNTHYHHDINLSYNLPTSKFPLTDWTSIRATYSAKYDWLAGSLLDRDLGNTIFTGQTRNVTGDFDFERLYMKWRLLQAINPNLPTQIQPKQTFVPAPNPQDTAKGKKVKVKKVPGQLPEVGAIPKFFLRLATSLKRIGVQYNEDMGTLLPGYLDSTRLLGMNIGNGNPGWKYILGYQPDTADINGLAQQGLLTRSNLFNALIQQRYTQHLNITAQVSPVRDFNINITIDKTFQKDYNELEKDTTGTAGIRRLNPYATGSFSVSFISYQTLFTRFNPNEVSDIFKQFEANRLILSKKLGGLNPYSSSNPNGYSYGYSGYAQDVLIPAFIAAYTKKDPMSVSLVKNSNPNLRSNPFSGFLPKPNWDLTYNGLSRVKPFNKVFTNFTLRHGYNSTLGMNNFTTALLFEDPLHVGFPRFYDTTSKAFVPYFLVPNVTISEQFSPLIGVDMTFVNQLSARFEYKKSRQLSLSLIDYQLAENRSTEFTIGMDWRRRNLPILRNIHIGRNAKPLTNDVTMRFDFSLRDDATANSKLDQNQAFGTGGQKVIRIAPSIDYVVNSRISLKFYFEQDKTIPKIATTAPVTVTKAGVQARISLAQ